MFSCPSASWRTICRDRVHRAVACDSVNTRLMRSMTEIVPNAIAQRRYQGHAGIKTEGHAVRLAPAAGEARILGHVRHNHDLIRRPHGLGAEKERARAVHRVDADAGRQPLPAAMDEGEHGGRRSAHVSGEFHSLVI